MRIKIGKYILNDFNDVRVNLKYDSIASTFSLKAYFNPNDTAHREIFRPGMLHQCTISHGGVLILTGTVMIGKFTAQPSEILVPLSGYSKTGILLDCPVMSTPLESNGLTFKEVCKKCVEYYGLDVIVDSEVADACNTIFPITVPEPDQSVFSYLNDIAKHLNVIISHTPAGEVYLTRVKADRLLTRSRTAIREDLPSIDVAIEGGPGYSDNITETVTVTNRNVLYDFTNSTIAGVSMELSFDAQKMHDVVTVVGEASIDSNNGSESVATNPYIYTPPITAAPFQQGKPVPVSVDIEGAPDFIAAPPPSIARGVRPRVVVQKKGDDNTAPLTARAVVGDELNALQLTIDIAGVTLNGNLVTPNQLITVTNSQLFIFKKSKWFIKEVTLEFTENWPTASLTCVVPECFNNEPIVNIFA